MTGVTIRTISWKRKGYEEPPYRVVKRDNCEFVQRRIPNANLRLLLEQAYFDLVQLGVDRVELSLVQPKQLNLIGGTNE